MDDNGIPDSLGPHMFVKVGVNTNIRCSHHFLSKLFDFLDGPWCSSLEATVVEEKRTYN